MSDDLPKTAIAIIGLSCRFPGCDTAVGYWDALVAGRDCVSDLDPAKALESGVSEAELDDNRVLRWGVLQDVEMFDAAFFGFTPREAEITDPQQRLFLELAAAALDDAGYGNRDDRPLTGTYAAPGVSGYERMVRNDPGLCESVGDMLIEIGNAPEHMAGRTAHKLNLQGPLLTVQTACSSGLVAVHSACIALLSNECDMAVAGAASVKLPQTVGYAYQPGGIGSADGRTRSFDDQAGGTVGGNGGGVVILRRLSDALADGDHVRGVILGSAVNNDGARRAGYASPSVDGQAAVIEAALGAAELAPSAIGYVECHGSATRLGDAVELAALARVFAAEGDGMCILGSVKSNLGHLREAAGIAGLIKAVLAIENSIVPPSRYFERWNRDGQVDPTRFVVATEPTVWPSERRGPRRAGVSSFGLGGTNAHLVLQEAPRTASRSSPRTGQLIVLSAATEAGLQRQAEDLAQRLEGAAPRDVADAAFVLQTGRQPFPFRQFVVATDGDDAAASLRAMRRPAPPVRSKPKIAFLLSGTGEGYRGLASGLYRSEPAFRKLLDECLALAQPWLDRDLRSRLALETGRPGNVPGDFKSLIKAAKAQGPAKAEPLTTVEQHCIDFAITYALAQFWQTMGIKPDAVLGYSLGEYVAATLAGVFDLADAQRIVISRAALISRHDQGGMLVVCDSAANLQPRLPAGVHVAAVNSANLTVVAGQASRLGDLQQQLVEEGVAVQRLPTRHAIHTPLMADASVELCALIRTFPSHAPNLMMLSNVTGAPLTSTEAADADHWGRHLSNSVQMLAGVRTLLEANIDLFVEIGPGQTLSSIVSQVAVGRPVTTVSSLPAVHDPREDREVLLNGLGRCWCAGGTPRWDRLSAPDHPRRISVPGYPFDRRRFSVPQSVAATASSVASLGTHPSPSRSDKDVGADLSTVQDGKSGLFTTPTELAVSELFSSVIGSGSVSRTDNFFEIGGHSLLALQLLLRVRKAFRQELDMRTLYRNPTVSQLAAQLDLGHDRV